MDWPRQCGVVIPCLNEVATIASVVGEVRAHLPVIVVVDDGSSDGTGRSAASAGADVIQNPQPRGKGAALTAGLHRLHARGFRWALTMDGDGQHAAADIPKFLHHAETKPSALILGNRMWNATCMPWLRRRVNVWMSQRLSRLAGRELPDSQCGFRMFPLSVWSTLRLQTAHYEFESELLLAFIAAGQDVEFLPIQTIYKSERSKINVVQDSWRWLRWWWSVSSRRGTRKNSTPPHEPPGRSRRGNEADKAINNKIRLLTSAATIHGPNAFQKEMEASHEPGQKCSTPHPNPLLGRGGEGEA